MATNLIDNHLKTAVELSQPVKLTLRDGSVVSIRVKEFDGFVALVEGDPDYLLYRHSILEVDSGPAHGPARREPRPATKRSGPPRRDSARPAKPKPPARSGKDAGGRNAPRKPRPEKAMTEEPGFGNTLADKLKAWQDSGKEGE